jgi:hypothetical protein
VVFPRTLDEDQRGFAFGEVVEHISYMLGRGDLVAVEAEDGMERVAGRPIVVASDPAPTVVDAGSS